jgi:hypothetical protein
MKKIRIRDKHPGSATLVALGLIPETEVYIVRLSVLGGMRFPIFLKLVDCLHQ